MENENDKKPDQKDLTEEYLKRRAKVEGVGSKALGSVWDFSQAGQITIMPYRRPYKESKDDGKEKD